MRFKFFTFILNLLIGALAFGYFYIQVIKGSNFFYLSEKNRVRIISQDASRGKILDRNGLTVVDSRISFNLLVSPRDLVNKEQTIELLSKILGFSREKIRFAIDKAREVSMYQPAVIFEDIPKNKAFSIEEKIFDLPGISIEAKPIRNYVYDSVGSHIFGYIGEVSKNELDSLSSYGYRMKDMIGRAGLEKYYDAYLKGDDGGMQVEVDSLGRRIKTLGYKVPRSGNSVEITIDFRLQYMVHKAMGDRRGAAIAMNPKTGEILLFVSTPEYDPNIFVSSGNNNEIKSTLTDSSKPLLNRCISAQYPPGSIFKMVTATAALELGKIKPTDTFTCSGRYQLGNAVLKCWLESGHGPMDLYDGIKNSCNVYFCNIGRKVGVDQLSDFAYKYGFGKPTGIDLPDEVPGVVPSRMWKVMTKKDSWYEGETLNYSIGQGALTVTPMQAVRMVSCIANDGELVQPYIVKKIGNINIFPSKMKNLNLSEKTLNEIKEGMRRVVQEGGTGKRANVEGLNIAGKTGTAQCGTGKTPHAWFVGFAPMDDPKISVVVLIENGGHGGVVAAEIAEVIFREAKAEGNL